MPFHSFLPLLRVWSEEPGGCLSCWKLIRIEYFFHLLPETREKPAAVPLFVAVNCCIPSGIGSKTAPQSPPQCPKNSASHDELPTSDVKGLRWSRMSPPTVPEACESYQASLVLQGASLNIPAHLLHVLEFPFFEERGPKGLKSTCHVSSHHDASVRCQ